MKKYRIHIKSNYGKSKCLGSWEDTVFTFVLEAPFWLTKVVSKAIEQCLKENRKGAKNA